MKVASSGFVVLALFLSGCLGPFGSDVKDLTDDLDLPDVSKILSLVEGGGGFAVRQPVDVMLVGFEFGTAAKLQALISDEQVHGATLDFVRNVPPDPSNPAQEIGIDAQPTIPTAVYTIREMDAAFAKAFTDHMADKKIPGTSKATYNANEAESYLAQAVYEAGVELDPARPAFVVLHAAALGDPHLWRYTYPSGWLDNVRAFGERDAALLFYDVSAQPDPFVVNRPIEDTATDPVFGAPTIKKYNYELEAGGDATVKNLKALVVDATHYRLLQPAIYPVSTKPCHQVTLVYALHQTAITEKLPDWKRAGDWLNVASLKASFEHLTGDEVQVDVKEVALPQDDPVLDALVRTAANADPALDAMRYYLDENWEKFVKVRAECEQYLSLLIFGDVATRGNFGGIGMYDVKSDRRISFSLWPEPNRIQREYTGAGEQVISNKPASETTNRVNLLYAHETGHLFGQHHPQHIIHAKGSSPSIDTFQSVYSTMSYQTGQRVHDFGMVDTANWQRNRVGYTVQKAQLLGLEKDPAFQEALVELARYDWAGAHGLLEPHVAGAMDHAHGDMHIVTSHPHPWDL